MKFFCLCILVCLWIANASAVDTQLAVGNPDILLEGIARTENPTFDPNKVGDRELTYKAHGILQIRQPYIEDVNRIVGKKAMMEIWGKSVLTIQDIKDPEKAVWSAKVYLSHYGKRYERLTGKKPTSEIYARIHNGGPDGWQKYSTTRYWAKVKDRMENVYAATVARGSVDKT
jgi:hypothetical protein